MGMTMTKELRAGQRISSGDDSGIVDEVINNTHVRVRWDSGVVTTQPISVLNEDSEPYYPCWHCEGEGRIDGESCEYCDGTGEAKDEDE